MTKKFVKDLLDYINTFYTCYYEKAPSNISTPYLVIPYLNISALNDCYLANFDIEIWRDETSNTSIEDYVDTLISNLDKKVINQDIAFAISLENTNLDKSNESDLNQRTVSFSARIYK